MKLFGYWTILVALVISGVAAYYSIVGLVAIFAAAMLPIIIMGGALEVGKLTTAVWLHTYWDKAEWHIKTYLSLALILLMFITSMGIFGFLSKAHIEQTAQATEGVAQLERIDAELNRYTDIIARAETKIEKLDNTDKDEDAGLQEKIDSEQVRIDTAYDRIQPAIDEQKQMLTDSLAPYEEQLSAANEKLDLLQQYADANDVKALQRLVGARADGQYGPGTAGKVEDFRALTTESRDSTLLKMQELRDASAAEIQRLRGLAEAEIADSNKLISRLRDQLGRNSNAEQVALDITAQRDIIKESNEQIDALYEKKYAIEGEARKLEAEVGPVKYIAELVYGGEADTNTLEQAVRWVIIILVIVFDPLAVVLIIAGITLVEEGQRRNKRASDAPKKIEPQVEDEPVTEHVDWEEQDVEAVTEELLEEIHKAEDEIHELHVEMEEAKEELDQVLDAYNDDRLASKYDMETKEVEAPLIAVKEETIPVPPPMQSPNEQISLNRKARETKHKHVEDVIERMKKDGFWPSIKITPEVERLLANASPETVDEVYSEITKDLNQKKEI